MQKRPIILCEMSLRIVDISQGLAGIWEFWETQGYTYISAQFNPKKQCEMTHDTSLLLRMTHDTFSPLIDMAQGLADIWDFWET